jgi:hypothetical protein
LLIEFSYNNVKGMKNEKIQLANTNLILRVAKDILKEDVGLYSRFSKDFIMDENAVEDKVYYYFTMISKE